MIKYATKVPGFRRLWRKFPLGPVPLRAEYDIWPGYPPYGFGVWSAAWLANALGHKRMSVIECGVVTGNGLVCLDQIASIVGGHFGMSIEVVGVDSGVGLPPPIDYRDGAHIWGEGFYVMDAANVRSRLTKAELIVAPVVEGLREYFARPNLAPLGFVAMNLDYYSLTKGALDLFAALPAESRLPRIYGFFDDVLWPERACHNPWFGEMLAIREFNDEHQSMKVAQIPNLAWMRQYPNYWNEMMYVLHDFQHPHYTRLITPQGHQYRQM